MKQFFFDKNVRMAFAGLSCMALLGLPQSAVAQDMTVYPYAEDYQVITRDGAWCWFSDPRAIYVDDKMFGGFVDKEGSIWAAMILPPAKVSSINCLISWIMTTMLILQSWLFQTSV